MAAHLAGSKRPAVCLFRAVWQAGAARSSPALLIHQQKNIDIANEFSEILTGPDPETRPRLLSQWCFKKKRRACIYYLFKGTFSSIQINSDDCVFVVF